MLATTMVLCRMRDGITLSEANRRISNELPDWRLTDAALQAASKAIYEAQIALDMPTNLSLSHFDNDALIELADKALDIHLSRA